VSAMSAPRMDVGNGTRSDPPFPLPAQSGNFPMMTPTDGGIGLQVPLRWEAERRRRSGGESSGRVDVYCGDDFSLRASCPIAQLFYFFSLPLPSFSSSPSLSAFFLLSLPCGSIARKSVRSRPAQTDLADFGGCRPAIGSTQSFSDPPSIARFEMEVFGTGEGSSTTSLSPLY
jgi:hypothetical protein